MSGLIVGKHTYSVTGDIHYADIGDYCSIAAGVTVHDYNNHAWVKHRELVSTFPFNERFGIEDYPKSADIKDGGKTQIGNDVWIGHSSFILGGLIIGDGAIIGAHTVVAKDVPPYAIMVGNPGKVISYRFTHDQISSLLRIKWWEWEEEMIRARIEDFKDINNFIKKYDK